MAEWPKEGPMGRDEGGLGRWVCAGITEINERTNARTGELTYEYDLQFSGSGFQIEVEVVVSLADRSEVTGWKRAGNAHL